MHKSGIKDIQAPLPIRNIKRSKSPLFYLKWLLDKIKSKNKNFRKLRRRSYENNSIHQINKNINERKKSSLINSHRRYVIPIKITPKSPKIIYVQTINCNRMLGRDKSVLIYLQLKVTKFGPRKSNYQSREFAI